MPATPTLSVLGTRVASVTMDEAVNAVIAQARSAESHTYVCCANVHCVSMARRDEHYRRALNEALLAVPDGMPLVWAHRILRGRRLKERVYGPTLMLRVCEAAARENLPVFLYGGAEGVPRELAKRLSARFPTLKIAGAQSPPFSERIEAPPNDVDAINSSGARIVFVALGAPKQELFMHENRARIAPVMIGVGAAFDFHTGRVKQAPAWMQSAGLEWFFRLSVEPRRLWKRYLINNPYFIFRLFMQRLGVDEDKGVRSEDGRISQDAKR